jgi:hypothetical protein
MKIRSRAGLAAVATAGLIFAAGAPAAGVPVSPHKHCLYTPSPEGYVLIAEGLSEYAPTDPALEMFHTYVHRGKPGQELVIIPLSIGAEGCPDDFDVLPADAIVLE